MTHKRFSCIDEEIASDSLGTASIKIVQDRLF